MYTSAIITITDTESNTFHEITFINYLDARDQFLQLYRSLPGMVSIRMFTA